MATKILPYKEWVPALTAEQIFSSSLKFSEIKVEGTSLYWLEQRPAGTSVVMRRDAEGKETELTPIGMSVRTRVHEYGGGAFAASKGTVYFVNDKDQRIYAYEEGKKIAVA